MTDEDAQLLSRIVSTPGVMGGKPSIDGTRVGVSKILEALAEGENDDEIVEAMTWVTKEDIRAALFYAARQAEQGVQAAE